ncbi:hypothetical protein HI914_01355 [Erysiphe necator]|nr:hypothetical protein HI914_01355 [Erysiphe necator]
MRYFEILSLLTFVNVAFAGPFSQQIRARDPSKGASASSVSSPNAIESTYSSVSSQVATKNSVLHAAGDFGQDAGIAFNANNILTSMSDQDANKNAISAQGAKTTDDQRNANTIPSILQSSSTDVNGQNMAALKLRSTAGVSGSTSSNKNSKNENRKRNNQDTANERFNNRNRGGNKNNENKNGQGASSSNKRQSGNVDKAPREKI